jgi:predicted dehydrogenase
MHTSAIELTAVVDPVIERARHLVREYARMGGNADEIRIGQRVSEITDYIDAAVVASPHNSHEHLAVELASAGVHCLVEKPMALTVASCQRMQVAARATDVLMAVAHVRRLFPCARWVKSFVDANCLGKIHTVHWREGAPYDWPLVSPSLFQRNVAGGGVLADTGPHVFDLLCWWFGSEDAEVISCRDTSLGGAESEAEIELRLSDITVSAQFSRLRTLDNCCHIYGTRGSLQIGIDVPATFVVRMLDGRVTDTGVAPAVPPAQDKWELLFTEQLRNFAAAISGNERVYADASDGIAVVNLLEACYAARQSKVLEWRSAEWP